MKPPARYFTAILLRLDVSLEYFPFEESPLLHAATETVSPAPRWWFHYFLQERASCTCLFPGEVFHRDITRSVTINSQPVSRHGYKRLGRGDMITTASMRDTGVSPVYRYLYSTNTYLLKLSEFSPDSQCVRCRNQLPRTILFQSYFQNLTLPGRVFAREPDFLKTLNSLYRNLWPHRLGLMGLVLWLVLWLYGCLYHQQLVSRSQIYSS